MQISYFPDGGFVVHKAVNGRVSAWFDRDGKLLDAEQRTVTGQMTPRISAETREKLVAIGKRVMGSAGLAGGKSRSRTRLDPSAPLEGNAVAFFTVGGDERDGDPESIVLGKGVTPIHEVVRYLERRLRNVGSLKVISSDKIAVTSPHGNYVTKVEVEARAGGRGMAKGTAFKSEKGVRAGAVGYAKGRKPKNVFEKHQLKILLDTVRNPLKGKFLGGPSAEEAEEMLRDTFGYSDAEIRRVASAKKTAGRAFGYAKGRKPKNVFEKHQLKILLDTVRNPLKGKFLGGPSAEEAEEMLRDTFGYSDAEIRRVASAKKTAGRAFGHARAGQVRGTAWAGIDANERAIYSVRNALVDIVLSGVEGVSEKRDARQRPVPRADAERYVYKAERVLDSLEDQRPPTERARAWARVHVEDLKRIYSDAKAVLEGRKQPKKLDYSGLSSGR